jgi:hypothetical protein
MLKNFLSVVIFTILVEITKQANLLRSIYCPANAGIGTSYYSCQSCDMVFALDNSATPNCQPFPPAMYSYEADSTNGLTVNYPTPDQTPCGSLTILNGWLDPTSTVTVSYPGVNRIYSAIKLLVGIVK